MTYEEYAQYKNENSTVEPDGSGLGSGLNDPLAEWKRSQYLKEIDTLSGSGVSDGSLGSGIGLGTSKKLNQDEILARKQERLSSKLEDITKDDSNLMLKMKSAYNTVNDLWNGSDLKANYMGKQHTMQNKVFEDVNDTMLDSETKRQALIDQYNMEKDDPNAKHKVYQLRMKDGYDSEGNPIYKYKTGIAETSAAERYKNQMIRGGYEILSEKGFANAEEWENKWHGLKANIADRTFDEGYNSKGQSIKEKSGFGEGYSEVYNTGSFDTGQTKEELLANKINSESLAKASSDRRKDGYGKGSDSMVDAFQAGAIKTGLDFVDTALDIVTPGDNTWLDNVRDQAKIDKYVGYNRKTADKAIGEATARFNAGDYSGALFEVLKNPQITAESLPANLEMVVGFGKFTRVGKLAEEIAGAKKLGDATKVAEKTKELAEDVTASQKLIHNVASNAGFYSQVSQATNDQLDERVKNNKEAGMTGGDSIGEVGAVFASNFLSLGLDRIAFNKITGIEGGKKSLSDAYGFASPDGKRSLLNGVLNQAYKMAENGVVEGAQEYVQTWDEILNKQVGTGNKTLSDIFNDKANRDETIGAMLAGSAGGIHMGTGSEAIHGTKEFLSDEVFGGKERKNAERLKAEDGVELSNIASGSRSAEGLTGEDKISASKSTVGAVARNGHNAVLNSILTSEPDSNAPSELVDKFVKAVASEYADKEGAGSDVSSGALMNRNIATFVNNLFDNMNNMQWNSSLAEKEYNKAKDAGLVDDTTTPQDFMINKINKQKELVGRAIGLSLDNYGIDIKNTVMQRFKDEYIDKEIQKAVAKEKNKKGISADAINVGKKKKIDLVEEENTIELSKEQSDKLKNTAKILYAMSGNKDADLADMIDQLDKQNVNGNVSFDYRSKDVTRDVLKNGTNMGSKKSDKKSVLQHNYDINDSISDAIEASSENRDTSKEIKKVNDNIDKLLDFADSRTNGIEDYFGGYHNYGSKEDLKKLELLKQQAYQSGDNTAFDKAIESYVKSLIGSTKVGTYKDKNGKEFKENPAVKFSQIDKERRINAPIDEDYLNRFGRKNNTRKIYAGYSYNGIMSSISYETDKISEELTNSINSLNELKNQLASKNKDTSEIDKKINQLNETKALVDVSNKVFNEIHKQSQVKNSKYKKQIIKPGETFVDNKGNVREARLEDIAYELKKEDIYKTKNEYKKQTEEEYQTGEISEEEKDLKLEKLKQFINDKINKNNELVENENIDTIDKTLNDSYNFNADYGVLITDNEEAKNAKDGIFRLYKNVVSKIKEIVIEKNGKETLYDDNLKKIILKVGQDNNMNYAHEMFHALSFNKLSRSLTKSDKEFVSNVKTLIDGINIADRKYEKLSSRTIDDFNQLVSSDTNDRFTRELSAMLYSNGEFRRFIVSEYEKTIIGDKEYSKKRNDIAKFIESVFKAYKWVSYVIKKAFSEDKKQINTNSDAYRAMVKFVGNSIKDEASRTTTRYSDEFKDKYEEILNKFEFNKDGNLQEKGYDDLFEGVLRNDGNGKSTTLKIDIYGKSINQRGLDKLLLRLKLGTMDSKDFIRFNSVLKAYEENKNRISGEYYNPKEEKIKKETQASAESQDEADVKNKTKPEQQEQQKAENNQTEPANQIVKKESSNVTKEPEVSVSPSGSTIVNDSEKEFIGIIKSYNEIKRSIVSENKKAIGESKKTGEDLIDTVHDFLDNLDFNKEEIISNPELFKQLNATINTINKVVNIKTEC